MNIKEQLKNDLKAAMIANNVIRRDTIRLINAELKQVEVDKRVDLSNDDVISILLKAKKQRLDSIEAYKKANRDDLVKKEEDELNIILEYLPKQLSDDELRLEIKSIIESLNANGIKDLGKVMAKAKPLQTKADGARISKIAKEFLG
ncbi:GatB/YqeY domain-containing protein [Helicobacter sp. MIT 99-5507]|uniref:GatB/YqeY domain-containing protein n=1 Tax=Helicobacter sp. MIT 99-5507 TaxID=152489 RepID=UPI000E1E78A2|nr:GatB/YqeY domain-containing protein [Helicobacter sp. MIT 99-5507]RDU57860.1 glutamyl-tRNA amidotransferase [Helicobacter sp. MIT 99-5507]